MITTKHGNLSVLHKISYRKCKQNSEKPAFRAGRSEVNKTISLKNEFLHENKNKTLAQNRQALTNNVNQHFI